MATHLPCTHRRGHEIPGFAFEAAQSIEEDLRVEALAPRLAQLKLGDLELGALRSTIRSFGEGKGIPSVEALQRLRDDNFKAGLAQCREEQLHFVVKYLAAASEQGSTGIRFVIECELAHREVFGEDRPIGFYVPDPRVPYPGGRGPKGGDKGGRNNAVDMFYNLDIWAEEYIPIPEGVEFPSRLRVDEIPLFDNIPTCTTVEHAQAACASLCSTITEHGLSVVIEYHRKWSVAGAYFYMTVTLPDNQCTTTNENELTREVWASLDQPSTSWVDLATSGNETTGPRFLPRHWPWEGRWR